LLAAAILWLFPNAFRQLGRLPGDFHFKSGNVDVYVPLGTGLLLSLLLSLILRFLK
jgi:hypothetical protein